MRPDARAHMAEGPGARREEAHPSLVHGIGGDNGVPEMRHLQAGS